MCFVNSQNVRDLRQPFGGTKASRHRARGRHLELRGVPRAEERLRVAGHRTTFRTGASELTEPSRRHHGQARARRQDHPRAVDVPVASCDGPHKGCRQAAIDGHREIGRRCRELGVDTIVVFDVHWLVNANYHINCAPHFKGIYTSNELPHFIKQHGLRLPGQPGARPAARARLQRSTAWRRCAHDATTLDLEYGTLVPMRYMNADQHFKVVSVSALCTVHYLNDSARLGWAVRQAIEEHYDGTVAFFASGSLSPPLRAERHWRRSSRSRSGARSSNRLDHARGRAVEARRLEDLLRDAARVRRASATAKASCTTPRCCSARWAGTRYDGQVEVVTPYFGSSGTGQINAVFPVTPQTAARSRGGGLSADGYTSVARGSEGPPCPTSSSSTRRNLDARDRHDGAVPHAGRHHARGARRGRQPVFPTGGTRVLAYPAAHYAVADGARATHALRATSTCAWAAAAARPCSRPPARRCRRCAKAHFAPLLAARPLGLTLQIDEGHEVFDAKHSNLHPLFATRG